MAKIEKENKMNEMVMVANSKWINKNFGESENSVMHIKERDLIKSLE